jgi:hypothetical protein
MADDPPESTPPSPDPGRARREGPTIDLEATEVSGESQPAGDGAEPGQSPGRTSGAAISAALVAMVSGAVTAALVIAVAWYLGWPAETLVPAPPPASSAGIDALASRVAEIEAKESNAQASKEAGPPAGQAAEPASPAAAPEDPALAARLATLEQSLAALRDDVTAARAQSEQLVAEVNELKSAPHEAAVVPDLAAINDRLAQLERTDRAASAEIAQSNAKPADDVALRRTVAAALLDVMVRIGDPYPAALATAKALAPDPQALKPLDEFADSGVPTPATMSRDLLTLVPKLQPPAPDHAAAPGSGLVGRLEAGAAGLVRIERTDAVGNDRGAVVARITAAALRNDSTEARRELNTLAPADRAAAQAWLDRSEARDAALAASRAFAADAMTALAKPAP